MDLSLNCQSCHQPLQLDPSLLGIQQSQYELISASLPSPSPPSSLSGSARLALLPNSPAVALYSAHSPTSHNPAPGTSSRPPSNPSDSFVLLPSTTAATSSSLATSPKPTKHSLLADLFRLLSARTDIDHPLCSECARLLAELATERLEDVKRERDGLIAFEREVKEEGGRRPADEVDQLHKKLEELKADHARASTALLSASSTNASLHADLAALQAESEALAERERAFLLERNSLASRARAHVDAARAAEGAYALDVQELERLEQTNVYSDVFSIGIVGGHGEGKVGSINGLRLGRGSRSGTIDWPEINAAWGLALFCLSTLARKVGFKFETYRLVPLGSYSRIEEISGSKNSYELYGSSDLVARMINNRRYEVAMVAFLDCLRQLLEHARAIESANPTSPGGGWDLGRYSINKDKIGEPGREVSIRSGYMPLGAAGSAAASGGAGDGWTRACRYMLLELHRLIGWATRG